MRGRARPASRHRSRAPAPASPVIGSETAGRTAAGPARRHADTTFAARDPPGTPAGCEGPDPHARAWSFPARETRSGRTVTERPHAPDDPCLALPRAYTNDTARS